MIIHFMRWKNAMFLKNAMLCIKIKNTNEMHCFIMMTTKNHKYLLYQQNQTALIFMWWQIINFKYCLYVCRYCASVPWTFFRTIPQNTSVQSTALEKVYKSGELALQLRKHMEEIWWEDMTEREGMTKEDGKLFVEGNYCSCQHEKLFIVHNYQNKKN